MEELQEQVKEQKARAELFVLACARGLLDNAETLLGQGASVNVADRNGRRAAHFAAYKGELPILQLLASKGAELDAEDADGRSPVQYAAIGNHEACVKFLAEKNCWLDSFDKHDNSALHLAARHGAHDAARRLLHLGAKPRLLNQRLLTPLGEAIVSGNTKICHLLAPKSSDALEQLSQLRPHGYSMLHVAAACGEALSVKWLLDQGVDVNDADNEEQLSPLHCAVMSGNLIVVEQLIAAGASKSASNANGALPVDLVQLVPVPDDMPNLREQLTRALQGSARPKASAASQRSAASPSSKQSLEPSAAPAAGPTAAERLAKASTPDEVAEVMRTLARDHQLLRLNKWVALEPGALNELPMLTRAAKHCISQVKELSQLVARNTAVMGLRKDEYFQQDMRNREIRSSVDAVIADPNLVMRYLQQAEVMACLNKMRALRDVNKANGGGAINMDEILQPWTAADDQKAAALSEALDTAIGSALDAICQPSKDTAGDVGPSLAAAMQLKSSLGLKGSSEDSKEEALSDDAAFTWKNVLMTMAKQTFQSLAILAVILLAMWYQDTLPWQIRARSSSGSGYSQDGPAVGADSKQEL